MVPHRRRQSYGCFDVLVGEVQPSTQNTGLTGYTSYACPACVCACWFVDHTVTSVYTRQNGKSVQLL